MDYHSRPATRLAEPKPLFTAEEARPRVVFGGKVEHDSAWRTPARGPHPALARIGSGHGATRRVGPSARRTGFVVCRNTYVDAVCPDASGWNPASANPSVRLS